MSRRPGQQAEVHPVLTGLDPQQRAVATSLEGPVVVLAGAGTGKTRAMTHRIAYGVHLGVHEAPRSMALTFTNRAAGELRSRLRELGVASVAARTFHAAALRQLRHFWPQISRGSFPQLMASKARLVGEAAGACGIRADSATLRDLAADLEWAKSQELVPEGLTGDPVAAARTWSQEVAQVARVYAAYEELKVDRGLLDFEDVLLVMVQVLRDRPQIAAEVRSAYRWFTVDEYQDVNHLQEQLLQLWLGDRDDLCVVGDASQTVYAFTGATSKYLTGFATRFPQATEVRLVTCYRCSGPIVDLANAVIAGTPQPVVLQLKAVHTQGSPPSITAYDDDVDEAAAVADQVHRLIKAGREPSQIAVLYRINAQSAELETAFTDRGIPVVLRGGERFFDRAEIKEASVRLRGAARAAGSHDTAASVVEEVQAVLAAMGWTAEPPRAPGASRERWESLSALAQLAQEWAASRVPADSPSAESNQGHPESSSQVADFVAELDRRAEAGHAPQATAVNLASLHAAKGLECDVVYLVGCSEGLLPIHYAQSEEQLAEERRLAYVGITRARAQLHLSWARSRQPGGRPSRQLSRFL
ncbi:MAG: ATP-dependent helicase, partial [Actinomycetales bacterium]